MEEVDGQRAGRYSVASVIAGQVVVRDGDTANRDGAQGQAVWPSLPTPSLGR